jgi:protein-S-isoprenylcysteine O-methyltransferase Ste14
MPRVIEYDQPTSVPVPKVKAAGVAGVIVTAVVTVLALTGVAVPDNVSTAAESAIAGAVILFSAIQTIVTFAAAYFKKDQKPPAAVDAIQRAS